MCAVTANPMPVLSIDVRSDGTINCECANEGREVGKMLFIRDIELCCDCRFARLEIEFDTWGSDLYPGALFQGNKLEKVT